MTSLDHLRPQLMVAANRYTLDPTLVEAVVIHESSGVPSAIRYESGFWAKYMSKDPTYRDADPKRVSSSYGLMQVMFVVAIEMGFVYPDPEFLFVPSIGLDAGCKKLRQLLDWAHGVEAQALAAYNGGRGANSTPPYRNQVYATAVLAQRATVQVTLRAMRT